MRTLSIRILTYLIEYLGEFEFIFKTILDNESGDQISSFDEKKRHRKSHAWAPLSRRTHEYSASLVSCLWVTDTHSQWFEQVRFRGCFQYILHGFS